MVSTTMPMLALFFRSALVGLEAAAVGQPQVHDHDVGLQGARLAHRLGGRGGLADDLELAVALECVSQPLTNQVVIVDKEDLGARGRRRTGRHAWVTPLLERKRYPARYRAYPAIRALRLRLSRWGVAA
jgi:hypothetical protein